MSDERNSALTEQERRVRDVIRSTVAVRADAAFRERLKREFSDGTISESAAPQEERPVRSFPRWAWFLVPAAAAAILIFVLLLPRTAAPVWFMQAVHGEGTIEVEGQILATVEPERMAQALVAGGHVLLPADVGLDLRLDNRLVLALDPGSDVTLPPLPESGAQEPLVAEVHYGELRIMTGPGFPGTEMHILTPEGRTEITGTIISVQKGDGYTCVCVLEGTALIGPDETRLEEVRAGLLMVMFGEGSDPIVAEISSDHEAGLLEFEELYKDLFEQAE